MYGLIVPPWPLFWWRDHGIVVVVAGCVAAVLMSWAVAVTIVAEARSDVRAREAHADLLYAQAEWLRAQNTCGPEDLR